MTTRSIIDIEIRDKAWDEFQAAFNKFTKAVDGVPDAWAKVDKVVKTSSNPFKQIGAIIQTTTVELRQAATAQEKLRIAAVGTGKVFSAMGKSTATLAKNIKSVTLDLVRWGSLTSVFAGLLGAGGLFGLNRLAASVGGTRRESQGLGVSSGELQSARINYQKLVDVDSMLSKINEAQHDNSKRYAFAAAGLNREDWENSNPAEILKKLVPQMKKTWEQGDGSTQYAHGKGLDVFTDLETLNRLKSVTQEEIDAAQASYEADKKTLSLNEQTQRAWQNFQIQLTRAGSQIEMSFVRGLTGLTGPLSKLSAAVAHAVDIFLASPKIGEWIDKVGAALESFSEYLTSDDLEHDVSSFLEAVDTFAGSLWGVAKTIGKVFNFGNEQGLKASQYRKLEDLGKIDSKLAEETEWALKNPEAAKKADTDIFGNKGTSNLANLMNTAVTPQARALAQALLDNTAATEKSTSGLYGAAPGGWGDEAATLNGGALADSPFAKLVSRGEGGYGSVNRGLAGNYASGTENLEGMTVSQVMEAQKAGKFNAAGRYQIIKDTLAAAVKYLGISGDTKFDKGTQDTIFEKYLIDVKNKKLADVLHGKSSDFQGALKQASTEWASLADPDTGVSHYAGVANNKSSVSADEIAEAIRKSLPKDAQAKPDAAPDAGATRPPGPPYRQPSQTSQPLAVNIYKSPGADVFTTVNGMGYGN